MEDNRGFEKVMKMIPNKNPKDDFVEDLRDRISKKAEYKFKMKENQNNRFSFLSFWRYSLAFTSLIFLSTIVFVIYSSPETVNELKGYLNKEAKSALSNVVRVELLNTGKLINSEAEIESLVPSMMPISSPVIETNKKEWGEFSVFVFDLLTPDSPPLDVLIDYGGDKIHFDLYPGKYRIVVVDESGPVWGQEIDIDESSEDVRIDL